MRQDLGVGLVFELGIFCEYLDLFAHDDVREIVFGQFEHLDPKGHDLYLLHYLALLLQNFEQTFD